MIIKLKEKILALDGTPMRSGGPNGNLLELVLKDIIIEALLRPHRSEETIAGSEKLRRFQLAMKANKCEDEVELSIEEVALIKELVMTKDFPVLIVGRVCEMIEGMSPLTGMRRLRSG